MIWKLCYVYPGSQKYLGHLHKLLCTPIQMGHCEACNLDCSDIIKHYVMSCENYVDKRNIMLERIVDIFPVNDSVNILNQDENELLLTLFGKETDAVKNIDDNLWCYKKIYDG